MEKWQNQEGFEEVPQDSDIQGFVAGYKLVNVRIRVLEKRLLEIKADLELLTTAPLVTGKDLEDALKLGGLEILYKETQKLPIILGTGQISENAIICQVKWPR